MPSSMFAIIRTRWQTRPLSHRAKRRSSAAPGSLRKKYAGIAYPPIMVPLPNHSTTSGDPRKPVLRTTNQFESTFATVRHRTIRSKGCLSNKTALAMVFKLVEGAQKSWRRIDGHNQLPKLIQGVKFTDGIEVCGTSAAPPAAA